MPMSKKPRGNCLLCNKQLNRPNQIYCSNRCQADKKIQDHYKFLLNGQNVTFSLNTLRQMLHRYFDSTCQFCNLNKWQGKQIPLEIHHKDGNHLNNMLENLTLLCPNCHAITENYKYKNRKNNPSTRVFRRKSEIDKR